MKSLAQHLIPAMRTMPEASFSSACALLESFSTGKRDVSNPAQERILYFLPDRSGVFVSRLGEAYRDGDDDFFMLDDLRPQDAHRAVRRKRRPLATLLVMAADRLFPLPAFDAAARWIAECIGLDRIPRHTGLIVLEDDSVLQCSREHGGLFFSLPAPLEPVE